MVDDHGLVVAVHIAVMIVTVLDHDGVVAIAMVFLPDHGAVAIPVVITMPVADGDADRANAYPTSSAPAGMAKPIPATAIAITAKRLIMACSLELCSNVNYR
jgi:hypothetical protein